MDGPTTNDAAGAESSGKTTPSNAMPRNQNFHPPSPPSPDNEVSPKGLADTDTRNEHACKLSLKNTPETERTTEVRNTCTTPATDCDMTTWDDSASKDELDHDKYNPESSEDDEEEAQKEWESVVDRIRSEERDSVSFTNLEHYEQGLARRNVATERLEQVFQTLQQALQKSVEKMLQIAVPIFEATQARLEHQQDELVNTMMSNHERRHKMLATLDESHKIYESKYHILVGKVLQQPVESTVEDYGATAELEGEKAAMNGDPQSDELTAKSAPEEKEGDDSDDDEPDWDELASYAPTQGNVERYLQGRDRWHSAHERLVSYMGTLEHTLQESSIRILETAQNVYFGIQDPLGSQQEDIQVHLHSNVVRRHELQQALEQSAKEAQGLFATLMARVIRCMPSAESKRPGEGDPTSEPSRSKLRLSHSFPGKS